MTRCQPPPIAALGWMVAALALLWASEAAAREHTVSVAAGQNLEGIAKHFYGASWKAAYLRTRNRISRGEEIAIGTRLAIPASWIYRVKRGDSLAKIARRYLGDTDRYPILMRENGIHKPEDILVGQELLMPFHLTYTVDRGDSLSTISRRFYRTTKRAWVLRDYNSLRGTPKQGIRIIVPVFDRDTLGVRTRGPAPAGSSVEVTGRMSAKKVRGALDRALRSYEQGDFGAASEQLEALPLPELPHAQRAVVLRYLGFCAVAHGDESEAHDYFMAWLRLEPRATLDVVRTSPKILAIFNAAVKKNRRIGAGEN